MPGILDPIILRGKTVKNRIVMPPIVCFGWSSDDGFPLEALLEHYRRRAASGIGLVVVEATCVLPEGRLAVPQLGLWDDRQTEGLRKIADVLHASGAAALVQLHHAGRVTASAACPDPVGPSDWAASPAAVGQRSVRRSAGHARAASIAELENIREAFIQAAIRAADAGFDGVELHAAHGYLLSQMASSVANQRTDRYGGSPENRVRLATEIIHGIRDAVRPNRPGFILSARMGGY
ncbi:MAG TPA: NADH:flavin oxidoreductase, partial [Clostridia bacterium]